MKLINGVNELKKVIEINRPQKNKYKSLIIYFYIYAFLGWIVDVLIVLISDKTLENRGFLFEPICPMYGFAAIILLITLTTEDKNNIRNFVRAVMICTIFEYFTSILLEIIFQIRWWDYSNEILNINGRVCLMASLFWGFLSLIFIKQIHPFVEKNVKSVLKKIKSEENNVIKLFLTITIVDFLFSIANYIYIF